MKLNPLALAFAAAVLWGAVFLLSAIANAVWPPYAQVFLDCVASIYPGYDAAPTVGDIVAGTLYALVDGAIGGLLFAWLYNLIAAPKRNTEDEKAG
jgi:hypothetical protein